jgi:hypothetical protein
MKIFSLKNKELNQKLFEKVNSPYIGLTIKKRGNREEDQLKIVAGAENPNWAYLIYEHERAEIQKREDCFLFWARWGSKKELNLFSLTKERLARLVEIDGFSPKV